jgi:hypothetical protein
MLAELALTCSGISLMLVGIGGRRPPFSRPPTLLPLEIADLALSQLAWPPEGGRTNTPWRFPRAFRNDLD